MLKDPGSYKMAWPHATYDVNSYYHSNLIYKRMDKESW